MEREYTVTGSPLNLGGVALKNRIIFAPTTFGLPEDELLQKIERIAAGGCAMVIIGDVPVGRTPFGSIYSKRGFNHYKKLCDAVHAKGCKICAQLLQ